MGGVGGFHPILSQQLVSSEHGRQLLATLAKLVNLLLSGNIPDMLCYIMDMLCSRQMCLGDILNLKIAENKDSSKAFFVGLRREYRLVWRNVVKTVGTMWAREIVK